MRHALGAIAFVLSSNLATPLAHAAPRQMEVLDRGVVAIRSEDGSAFVSWRMLGSDPDDVSFNVYRAVDSGAAPVRVNDGPVVQATCLVDANAPKSGARYFVRAVVDGVERREDGSLSLPLSPEARPYLSIPLKTPKGYAPNDGSVGDLDGDGAYEIVLHQAGRGHDNAHRGVTDAPILQAYKLDGTMLWSINLGRNIREGAHYTQFIVYDLDGDGRAEVVCKTADGTTDGQGNVIGDGSADHRTTDGLILTGPEFLTVFDGLTGRALATTEYLPPRGNVSDWGDDYGNRSDRFLACVAYLDGKRPSVLMCRGYYTRAVLAAWNWTSASSVEPRDGKLSHLWTFDSNDPARPQNRAYRGQGAHALSVGDVDADGRDEIVYGACCIDDDGTGLYSTALGHGDALHLSDMDPDRPGLEVFMVHERAKHPNAASFRDARTGQVIWGKPCADIGRGVAMDIDPRHAGYETWVSMADGLEGVWNARGERIAEKKPRSCNFGVWWDGDLLRELLDQNYIAKWDWDAQADRTILVAEGCGSNNGTKATPVLCGDILGDWREEVIWRTEDNAELRIYTTTIPTEHRLRTLMHDPQYRLSVAWQNVAYNQPTQPGFFLGHGMRQPARAPSDSTERPSPRR